MVVDPPATSPSSTHSRWFGETRNIVEQRQPNRSSEDRATRLSWREPVDEVDPRPTAHAIRPLSVTCLMMYWWTRIVRRLHDILRHFRHDDATPGSC